jgi:hypothetical protein
MCPISIERGTFGGSQRGCAKVHVKVEWTTSPGTEKGGV